MGLSALLTARPERCYNDRILRRRAGTMLRRRNEAFDLSMTSDEPVVVPETIASPDGATQGDRDAALPTPDAPAPARRVISRGAVREFVETIVLALILFAAIRVFVMNYRVVGHSMEPNVHEGQYLFIDKLLYSWGAPRRGDIIVLKPPDAPGQIYLKRVVGLPGETVEVRAGVVLVHGRALEEAWATRPFPQANWGPAQIGDDELFVLGDNRPGSRDSRYFGMLKRDRVVGRAFLCYWPPSEWTIFGRYVKE